MTWLQHVNVVVAPGATAPTSEFYQRVFGLVEIPKSPNAGSPLGAWLQLDGGQQIHISEREGEPHADAHFAVVVHDFDAVLRRIADAGATWQDQAEIFGGRRGFTRDPAGNRIEVLEATGDLAG
ncbi:MAG: VOC family protein [Mycobacteriales bacterium]